MMMTDNYLKAAHQIFFFDSRDPMSLGKAWEAAKQTGARSERMAVWKGSGEGRYPAERRYGDSHPIVTDKLSPIDKNVKVVGYSFESDQHRPATSISNENGGAKEHV